MGNGGRNVIVDLLRLFGSWIGSCSFFPWCFTVIVGFFLALFLKWFALSRYVGRIGSETRIQGHVFFPFEKKY